ncbi:MAG: chemotaxis response regulator protein-glutamate methylesterase [Clostridiales bacterium]|nr:chemotaxis response regulator protein-glutamate methylesterase [Clostridiales bacterium]
MKQIRVLVVEDSLVFRELLVKSLNSDEAINVVAAVSDPFQARDAILEHKPDVMTLDIELPRMNGIEFLRKLMPQYPIPAVVISSMSDKVFDALSAGATDFVAKPQVTDRRQLENFMRTELPLKIKIASTAKMSGIRRSTVKLPGDAASHPRIVQATPFAPAKASDILIAIGASTGGTEAIASVLKEFRADTPGIVIVQHMPAGFTEMYAKRLDDQCSMHVKEAETGDAVVQGQALLAPGGDRQMRLVQRGGRFQVECREGPKVNGHCPSVDVLFESVAQVAGKKALGIILTGMGGDGAKGMLKMREAGSPTIGQDESTCVVYGMPRVAYELGAVQYQEKLEDIPQRAYSLLSKM